jgi:hypothetical protein
MVLIESILMKVYVFEIQITKKKVFRILGKKSKRSTCLLNVKDLSTSIEDLKLIASEILIHI